MKTIHWTLENISHNAIRLTRYTPSGKQTEVVNTSHLYLYLETLLANELRRVCQELARDRPPKHKEK